MQDKYVKNYEYKEREHLIPFLVYLQNKFHLTELEVLGLLSFLWTKLDTKINLGNAYNSGYSTIMKQAHNIIDKFYENEVKQGLTLYLKYIYTDNYQFIYNNTPNPNNKPPAIMSDEYVMQKISQRWANDGKLYSDRIWENKNKLKHILNTRVKESIMNGHDIKKTATIISKEFGTAYSNVERLVRTETNFVLNQAQLDVLKDLDYDKYEYIATLDYRTSKICRRLNGKIFNLKDAQVGVNCPPMHPNCRSTIAPYID